MCWNDLIQTLARKSCISPHFITLIIIEPFGSNVYQICLMVSVSISLQSCVMPVMMVLFHASACSLSYQSWLYVMPVHASHDPCHASASQLWLFVMTVHASYDSVTPVMALCLASHGCLSCQSWLFVTPFTALCHTSHDGSLSSQCMPVMAVHASHSFLSCQAWLFFTPIMPVNGSLLCMWMLVTVLCYVCYASECAIGLILSHVGVTLLISRMCTWDLP